MSQIAGASREVFALAAKERPWAVADNMAVILVVDDEETVIYITTTTLGGAGHRIHCHIREPRGERSRSWTASIDLLMVVVGHRWVRRSNQNNFSNSAR